MADVIFEKPLTKMRVFVIYVKVSLMNSMYI